jgi:hypothetical protein
LEVFWNLKRKRRLASKDFLELYDLIWKDSAPVKYQNPDQWLARAMGKNESKQYG